ncbi:glycoside hydrolase family 43 protein [Marinobacter sp. M1N3S26]|uniref:glycoside hydrolase family 43 protein n=1 Tax=Marinobacter sp. M1N3S26 TaxID=3382299 RepID=UPI00387AE819
MTSILKSGAIPLMLFALGTSTPTLGDILFEQGFSSGTGSFSASGRVSTGYTGAVLRGGSSPGSLVSPEIDVAGGSNLELGVTRQTSRLDAGESGRIEVAINGGPFQTLEASDNVSGNAVFPLDAGAERLVIRFSTDANSYFESYTIADVRVEGDNKDPSPEPPDPDPNPGPGNGESEFWELSGNLGTHDPTIAEENGIWYEFQTGPGIYRKISYDGGRFWEPLPSVFGSGLWWWRNYVPGQQGTDVWAPDVKAYNGRVWMYYAVSTFGSNRSVIGLASSPSLAADNWRDDGAVLSSTTSDNFNALDPDLVIDANNEPWLAFGSFWSGIKLVKLNPSTMKPTGRHYSLANRSGGIEAPTIVHRNGYYYLFVSVGKCCEGVNSTYRILYGRSRYVTGPYLDRSGRDMMNGGGSLLDGGNQRWVGPGGQDIAGTGVIARHAYDASDNGNAKLLINNLVWTDDGWPSY